VIAVAALVPVDHFLIMTIYALLVSAFFGTLWRNQPRDRVRLSVKIFAALMVGGLALAWLMYPFPS
jgi:hypothetical protein